MKNPSSFGSWISGDTTSIDVTRLLETRALIQANSGGGKSYALRKLLEVTAGHVQQLIIDPEGEYASLREKHDYIVVAAAGGDALAHPKTARLLAIRLLETGASAVLDLYELKAHERHQFVQLFIESLMNAPKSLWHPVLVPVDEAHLFCPEKGQGESVATEAIIDLATRGRKRGFALVAATQRIGKFHKSAAAELKNKLIGSTGLDVDVKRAAFELGLSPKEALAVLRSLKPGHFFGFGPALSQVDPRELIVGKVQTMHPEPGSSKMFAPPPPTAAIKALLSQLDDLPKQAEEEARTVDELRKESIQHKRRIAELERDLRKPKELAVDVAALERAHRDGFNEGANLGYQSGWDIHKQAVHEALSSIVQNPPMLGQPKLVACTVLPVNAQRSPVVEKAVREAVKHVAPATRQPTAEASTDASPSVRKILDVIHRSFPVSLSFDAAARRAAISNRSSAYRKYRAAVEASTEVELQNGKIRGLPQYANGTPISSAAGIDEWASKLPPAYGKMLRVIHEQGPVDKDRIAELAGVSKTSSGLGTGLRELCNLQLVECDRGRYQLTDGLG